MQFGGGKPPVGVVFDSDFGNRIDDALALAVLYGLDGKNECRVVSITISKPNLKAAEAAEVVGRFYSGAVSGAFNAVGRTLPIGLAMDGARPEDTPILDGILNAKTAEGKAKYEHGIRSVLDTAEPHPVIRNAFTAQHDQNCIVVLAGPATNLVKAMKLPGVKDWIDRKVRYLVVSGGDFRQAAQAEPSILADVAAARELFAEWPTQVVVAGNEVGAELPFPGESIEKDFAWSQAHPVVDAYRAAGRMPYDAPAFDLVAMLYAVRPGEGYFKLSDPGTVQVSDDGRTKFVASAQGRHRHLIFDPAQKEKTIRAYVELASAKPVVRMPRFRQQQQQQQQQKAPPPAQTPPSQAPPAQTPPAAEPEKRSQ